MRERLKPVADLKKKKMYVRKRHVRGPRTLARL